MRPIAESRFGELYVPYRRTAASSFIRLVSELPEYPRAAIIHQSQVVAKGRVIRPFPSGFDRDFVIHGNPKLLLQP